MQERGGDVLSNGGSMSVDVDEGGGGERLEEPFLGISMVFLVRLQNP